MKMTSVFSFLSYRKYLDHRLYKSNDIVITTIEKQLNYKSSSLNKVVRANHSLPLEKSILLAKILKLDKEETEFFITLVEYEEAGSQELRNYFLKRIYILSLKKFQRIFNQDKSYQMDLSKTKRQRRISLKKLDTSTSHSFYSLYSLITKEEIQEIKGVYINAFINISNLVKEDKSNSHKKKEYIFCHDIFKVM